jgi:uncharacterized membrane protein YhaH (DUF805 family)
VSRFGQELVALGERTVSIAFPQGGERAMNPSSMTPVDWAKRPILEKYADFTGRAPRPELWWYLLGLLVAYLVVGIVESILGIHHMVVGLYGPLSTLLWLATIVPSIAVGVRRLHDVNRPGWWILLPLIPECLMIVMALATTGAVVAGGGLAAAIGGMAVTGLLGLITLIGAIVVIVFYATPSTPGDNRYGPNPNGAGPDGAAVAAE